MGRPASDHEADHVRVCPGEGLTMSYGFCPKCGTALGAAGCPQCDPPQAVKPSKTATSTKAQPQPTSWTAAKTSSTPGTPAASSAPKAKSSSRLPLVLAGLAIVAVICVVLVQLGSRSSGDSSLTAGTTTADPGPTQGAAQPAPAPAKAAVKVTMGPDSQVCEQGTGAPFTQVWSGLKETSCPFSINVGQAFRAMNPPLSAPVTLTVHSPVTDKDYTVVCEPTDPVRCTTETGATVYVVP